MSVEEAARTAREIDAEAACWAARASGGLDATGAQALETWLAADARHRGSYLRASALAHLASADMSRFRPAPIPQMLGRRRLLGGTAAAMLLGGGLFAGRSLFGGEVYETKLGESLTASLSDGSVAVLDTQSAVRVALASDRRAIRLYRGEAWFDVAHDPTRPFTVEAGALSVRAIGTQFIVRHSALGSEVVVTEGIVSAWSGGDTATAIRIGAGQRGSLSGESVVPHAVSSAEQEAQLAWRSGMIVLYGQSLGEAAAQFNRYNPAKIVIVDPSLSSQKIYGAFRIRDPEAFAHSAAVSFGAISTKGDETITLARAI